jgi:hypothetical protein
VRRSQAECSARLTRGVPRGSASCAACRARR